MAMDRIVANVYETRNYDMFKKLIGYRDVTAQRVEKIKASIQNVGYVLNPCVINGTNEVIDGQGRIEVLKQLGYPVHYVIDKNAGLEQCVQLNINGTPWKTRDYVESYAHQGMKDYVNLLALLDAFPDFAISVITYAVNGNISDKSSSGSKALANRSSVIKGTFKCSDKEKDSAYKKLEYAHKFFQIGKTVHGNDAHFYRAIIFAAFVAGANKERLHKKVFELQQNIVPFTNVRQALASITTVYNHCIRGGKKVDFEAEYIMFCQDKRSAYTARWLTGEAI